MRSPEERGLTDKIKECKSQADSRSSIVLYCILPDVSQGKDVFRR